MKFLGTNSTSILDSIKNVDCEFNYRGGCLFIRIDGREYKTSTIKKIDINGNKIEFHSKNSVYIFRR